MNTLYNRFTLDYSRQKSNVWLPFQAMITAGQRSGQKHLASLPGPSRSTTRMKRIGSSSWSSCMSMHGERGKKIKDHDSMRPFRDQLKLCEGQVEQQGGVLVPQLIENLRPQFERMPPKKRYWSPRLSATVLSVVQTSFAAKRRTPTRLEKRSQPFVGLKLFTWITDISISQPEILWEDLLDTLWILKFLAAIHWLVHQTTWVMWKLIINMHQFIHTQLTTHD